jgi:anti-anti-sigma factor
VDTSRIAAAIIASSEDAIYSKSLDGIIQSWNAAAARTYGYAAEDIVGRSVTVLLPPERVEEEQEILARLARGERIERYETERLRKDGTRFEVQLTISPIYDEDGRIIAASTSTQDITDRKRTERQLRYLAGIVESSEDAIYSKSLDGVIQSWNGAAARTYGYAAPDIVGRSVTVLLAPERIEEERDILARLARGERIERYETERLRKDGTRFEAQLTISPIHDEHGRIVGASTSTQDITDRKRAERQQNLLVGASDLVAASRSVDELLGGLSALLVPAFADWCSVDLVEETGALRNVTLVHRDRQKTQLGRRLRDRLAGDTRTASALRELLTAGRPHIQQEISEDVLGAAIEDREILAEIRALGLKSAVAAPLVARGRSVGVITLIAAESDRRYSAHDEAFVEQLAQRAALGLDNVRLHEAETEARRAAEIGAIRIGRLQAFTAALSEALTPKQVGDVTVDHIVQTLGAAAAAVFLRSDESGTLTALVTRGYPPEMADQWRHGEFRIGPLEEAMRSGRVVWYPSWDAFGERASEARRPEDDAPDGAIAAAPVMVHGRALGGLYMNFSERRRFAPEELELMLTFGRQCGQAVERARLYAREHQVASTLQQALLPSSLPDEPGMELDAVYVAAARAADVGGDWYDVFRLPDGRLCAAIGDVVGHGLEAAVIMGQMRQAVRTAALEGHAPAKVLQLANHVLRLNHQTGMTTAIVAILDPVARTLTYAAAGHPGPLLASNSGVETLASGGLPIGFITDTPPSWTVQLPHGARLVLYTDGLIEFARDPAAGHAALVDAVRDERPHAHPSAARRILERVLNGAPPIDDIAIVVLTLAAGPVDRLDVTLPAEPGSLRIARQALYQLCAGLGLNEAGAFALNVAVGEAVNNVIEHAYGAESGTLRLRARRENSTLRIEVEDAGRWRPDRPEDNLGGRGFKLMRALIDDVQVATGPDGTRVRLTMALDGTKMTGDDSGAPAVAPRQPGGPEGAAVPAAGTIEPPRLRRSTGAHGDLGGVQYDTRLEGTAPAVVPAGDIDLGNISQFVRMIEEAAGKTQGLVVVVLDRVSYFDSQGVRALLKAQQRLATSRRKLAIVVPRSSPVRRLLDISGLQAALPIFSTVDEAVAETPP